MAYTERVIEHYERPRNVGSFESAEANVGTGVVGAPECGDVMKLQLKINPQTEVIEDAKFKTFGCGVGDCVVELCDGVGKGEDRSGGGGDQEHADCGGVGLTAGEDPLFGVGGGCDQGGGGGLAGPGFS